MKRALIIAAVAATAAIAMAPSFAADVGVSVTIGQPGFYGRLDLGDFPPPQVLYPQPVIIAPVPVDRPPIYLRVPPGQAKHWGRYCGRYNACGERVFFVRDEWYRHEYAPRYQERHRGERWDDHRDHGHDRHDDDDRGHGHH